MFEDYQGYMYGGGDSNEESSGIFAGSDGSAESVAILDESTYNLAGAEVQNSAPVVSGGGWSNSSGDLFGTIGGWLSSAASGLKSVAQGGAQVAAAVKTGTRQVQYADKTGNVISQSNLTGIKVQPSQSISPAVLIGIVGIGISLLK